MRIIGGKYKGRKLHTPTDNNIRPTSDRLRESLFNILSHRAQGIEDLLVMDVFAGTGSQGIEALSRGAEKCIFIEKSLQSLTLLRKNIALLEDENKAVILNQNATMLSQAPQSYAQAVDLVFMDAPFERAAELTQKALQGLYEGKWLAGTAWIIVKYPAKISLDVPENFRLIRNLKAGNSQAFILECV